jgi:cytochrome c
VIRLLLILGLLAAPAWADEQEAIDEGRALAEANCAICHAVGPTGTSKLSVAPPFRDIAARYEPDELEDAFNDGVVTDHPAMPDWQMTPDQAHSLATYIMSLQAAGRRKAETLIR